MAEAAKAAARHDKGILPRWAVSTEHYVLASVRTVRGARRADEATEVGSQRTHLPSMRGGVGGEWTYL